MEKKSENKHMKINMALLKVHIEATQVNQYF
jgi:hypothetical protein